MHTVQLKIVRNNEKISTDGYKNREHHSTDAHPPTDRIVFGWITLVDLQLLESISTLVFFKALGLPYYGEVDYWDWRRPWFTFLKIVPVPGTGTVLFCTELAVY